MLIGQDRSGKTSLRRYLAGETFNEQEPSTDGIEMIPSIKNAGTGAWKNPADLKTTSAFHHKFAEVVTEEISSSSKNSAQLFIEERRETQKVTQETPSKLLIHETSELVLSESIGSKLKLIRNSNFSHLVLTVDIEITSVVTAAPLKCSF